MYCYALSEFSNLTSPKEHLQQQQNPHSCNVWSHRMHEQEVIRICFQTYLLETRAAIGTAETPAEPISGFIGVDEIFSLKYR